MVEVKQNVNKNNENNSSFLQLFLPLCCTQTSSSHTVCYVFVFQTRAKKRPKQQRPQEIVSDAVEASTSDNGKWQHSL